jgi:hypothetical protein
MVKIPKIENKDIDLLQAPLENNLWELFRFMRDDILLELDKIESGISVEELIVDIDKLIG